MQRIAYYDCLSMDKPPADWNSRWTRSDLLKTSIEYPHK